MKLSKLQSLAQLIVRKRVSSDKILRLRFANHDSLNKYLYYIYEYMYVGVHVPYVSAHGVFTLYAHKSPPPPPPHIATPNLNLLHNQGNNFSIKWKLEDSITKANKNDANSIRFRLQCTQIALAAWFTLWSHFDPGRLAADDTSRMMTTLPAYV